MIWRSVRTSMAQRLCFHMAKQQQYQKHKRDYQSDQYDRFFSAGGPDSRHKLLQPVFCITLPVYIDNS